MKLKELYEELQSSDAYQSFLESHPQAFLTAGMFIMNSAEKEGDSLQLDVFVPEDKKMTSFTYPFASAKTHDDHIENRSEITNHDLIIDLPDVFTYVEEVCKKPFPKVVAIFQDDEWNITAIDGMDIRLIKVNAYTKERSHSENLNLQDIIQIRKPSKE